MSWLFFRCVCAIDVVFLFFSYGYFLLLYDVADVAKDVELAAVCLF